MASTWESSFHPIEALQSAPIGENVTACGEPGSTQKVISQDTDHTIGGEVSLGMRSRTPTYRYFLFIVYIYIYSYIHIHIYIYIYTVHMYTNINSIYIYIIYIFYIYFFFSDSCGGT